MKIVLDTSILVELERKNPEVEQAVDMLASKHGFDIFITAPTLSEYYYGLLRRRANAKVSSGVFEKYHLLNTSKSSSLLFAELQYKLESLGLSQSQFDLLIASICVAEGALLVTADSDFSQMPGLNCIIVAI